MNASVPQFPTHDLLTPRQAVFTTGISRTRLEHALMTGELERVYSGMTRFKVRRADVERVLRTPPRKASATE